MAERLFLRIADVQSAEPHLEWMLLDDPSGIVRFRGEGSISDYQDASENLTFAGQTIVMLASEQVLLTHANVPSKQARQVLQAVPYMVEEQLATDVEQCHFAIGDRLDSGEVSVAVINRGLMQAAMDLLTDLNVTPNIVTVDVLSVPQAANCNVLVDAERALIRTGGSSGFAVETDMMATHIGLLSNQQKNTVSIIYADQQSDQLTLQFDQLNAELEEPVQLDQLQYAGFESLCRYYSGDGINLLQGEFKPAKETTNSAGAWRSVALIAICAFVLHVIVVMGQAVYLDIEAQRLDAEARSLYAEVYPQDRNVRDLRRRWQNHLRGGGGDGGEFLPMFIETTKHLPGTNISVSNLNYNQSRGDLVMQLEANQSQELISFAETLKKMGLTAEIGTINQSENGVRGSVKVRMQGGAP